VVFLGLSRADALAWDAREVKQRERSGRGHAVGTDVVLVSCVPERTWFTSDLHLGHANIVRYCHRPFLGSDGFPDVELMGLDILERFSALVGPEDTLVVLGDVAMGHVEEILRWVAELPGPSSSCPATMTGAGAGTVRPAWTGSGATRWPRPRCSA